jgi:hypothetical protein
MTHWTDDFNLAMSFTHHLTGFTPNGDNPSIIFLNCHNGRLTYNDSASLDIYQRISGSEIHRYIAGKIPA